MMQTRLLRACLVVLLTLCSAGYGSAAIINESYSGTFPANIAGSLPDQGSVLLQSFTLSTVSNLTITSTSYQTGGFSPNLLLFNGAGNLIAAGQSFGAPDPNTALIGDQQLTAAGVVVGSYTLALTDFALNQSLTATNLSEGFTLNYGTGDVFIDPNGNERTGEYALTISAVPAAVAGEVPEPGTALLVAPLLAALALKVCTRPSARL